MKSSQHFESLSAGKKSGRNELRLKLRKSDKNVYNLVFEGMNPLDMNRINRLSPYKVWTEDERNYLIETNRGHIFVIGFMDDYSIWTTGAYQFTINNRTNYPSPLDMKLRETILLLIEAFFAANPDILLYICETGDGKQAYRSRLFIRWFNSYSNRDAYVLETAEVQDGDTRNFAALIVQKSNPRLKSIIAEFDETISILTDKPEE